MVSLAAAVIHDAFPLAACPPMLNAHTDTSGAHQLSCDKTWADFAGYVRVLKPAWLCSWEWLPVPSGTRQP